MVSKQIALLYKNLKFSLATSTVVALLVFFFLRDFVQTTAMRTWLIIMLLIILYRGVCSIFYHSAVNKGPLNTWRTELVFVIGSTLTGFTWGCLGWWIYPMTLDPDAHFLLFIVLVGMAGGSITVLAYRLAPSFFFISFTLLPLLIGLYRTPGKHNFPIGIALIIYYAYLIKNAQVFQKNSERMFILQEEAQTREKMLNNARCEAEEASQAKSRFLANVSHEIRTPMNSIIGRTRFALDGKPDAKTRSHLEMIRSSSADLLSLINDILDFSKIEAGEFKIINKPFDLHEVLISCIDTIKVLIEEKDKDIDLRYEIGQDVPLAINGDRLRLRQILLNLLNNAVKFTESGSIDVAVSLVEEDGRDLILQFTVQDTGIGIRQAKQEYIFNEFAQEDDSLTRRFGGTGLGLAICKQLCQLMGGDISVTSAPKQGSTFIFTIRASRCEASEIALEKEIEFSPETPHAPLSLLLVEDNEANRALARMVLENNKHSLMEAHNGLQALQLLCEETFDAVLMDVQMPVMDGLTATQLIRSAEQDHELSGVDDRLSKQLRQQLSGNHIPIIAMTANALSGDREKCLEAGMDEYIPKPFQPEEVTRILQKIATPRNTPQDISLDRRKTPRW